VAFVAADVLLYLPPTRFVSLSFRHHLFPSTSPFSLSLSFSLRQSGPPRAGLGPGKKKKERKKEKKRKEKKRKEKKRKLRPPNNGGPAVSLYTRSLNRKD